MALGAGFLAPEAAYAASWFPPRAVAIRGGSTDETPGAGLPRVVNLAEAFSTISEPWAPRVAGDVNEFQVKLARAEGEFCWHVHEDEDELFLVVGGTLRMQFRGGHRDLGAGEMIIVPKGVEHCPLALSDHVDMVLLESEYSLLRC